MTEASKADRLMQGVIPYLAIDGADAAITFYKQAFGAIQHGDSVRGENGKILNAGLEINGGMIMLSDHFPEHGHTPAKGGQGIGMQIVTLDGQAFWDRAVAAGCTVRMPFEVAFWGDKFGEMSDPFGIFWAVNEPSAANRVKATTT